MYYSSKFSDLDVFKPNLIQQNMWGGKSNKKVKQVFLNYVVLSNNAYFDIPLSGYIF